VKRVATGVNFWRGDRGGRVEDVVWVGATELTVWFEEFLFLGETAGCRGDFPKVSGIFSDCRNGWSVGFGSSRLRGMWLITVLLLAAAAGVVAHEVPDVEADPVPELDLTAEERAWLAAHPVLRLGIDPAFAPYELVDPAGRYLGIGAEYVQLLSRRLGIEFRVLPGLGWQQVMEQARNKELDLLAAVVQTPERKKYLNFTRVYVKFPFVVVTRRDHPVVDCVSELSDKRVALVQDYAATELTLLHNPAVEPLYVDSVEQALQAVAFGRADATVGELASLDYYMQEGVLANLKVAGAASFQAYGLRMAVRDDWPVLASILDKALATVTPEEHRAVRRRWVGAHSAGVAKGQPQVELTDEEREWVRRHPRVVLGISGQWQPAVDIAENGAVVGMMPDLLRLLSSRLGMDIQLETGVWEGVVEKAERGEIDGLAASVVQPTRGRHFNFTVPYAHAHKYVFVRSDAPPVRSLAGLSGKRVAYTAGNELDLSQLRPHPGIEPVECSDVEEKIGRLLTGEVDAAIGSTPFMYRLLDNMRMDIRVAFPLGDEPESLAFAVRKDWPELVHILNKGLASITPAERIALYRRWMPADDGSLVPSPPDRVILTAQEEQWLQAHPRIRVGYDPVWAPLGFTDRNGAFAGVSADYLEEVGKQLGIRFQVETSPSWKEVLQRASNKELDLVPGIRKTPERVEQLEFTQPYLSSPVVIYAGPDLPYVGDLSELNAERVLVVEQHAGAQLLRRDYPQIELVTAATVSDALLRLSRGEAKAFVGNLLTSGYYIGQLGLSNLKVVGQTPYSFDLAMAVRGDWPVLAGLLRKALDAIPEERRNAIYRDWIAVRYEQGLDYSLFWKFLAGAAVLFIAVLLWSRVLSHKVAKRTKQFQDELLRRRQSEEHFRFLYEHAPLPYHSLDEEGRFVAVNQAFEEISGYTRDDVMGNHFTDLLPDRDRALFPKTFQQFLAGGHVHAGVRLRRKDGVSIYAELAGVIARRPDGSFLQTHCVWADVTERRRAEKALRDQRDFLESIFNKVDYAVFVVEVLDGDEFRYLATNRRHQEWTKLAPKEIIGKTPADLIPHVSAEVAEGLQESYRACAHGGESIQYEELVPIKQREIWWSTRLTPLKDSEGRVCRIIGTTTDITQRHLAERRLQEQQGQLEASVQVRTAELEREIARRKDIEDELLAEKYKAEAANNAKSVFLANMSHELRTPLNAVLGYARILQKGPQISTGLLEGLQVIERGGRHLHTLINDILDIARIEAGRLVLEPVPMRLGRFLRELVAIVRTRAEDKGIEVEMFTDPGLPSAVLADEKRLRQVLLNLLSNAVKFTDEGRVALNVSSIEQESTEEVCRLIFEVKDTGIGIATDQLERIFRPFEQVGQTCHEEGTGLGLAISKQLVNKMGGELTVQSALGEGSRFCFELEFPVEDLPEAQAGASSQGRFMGYTGPRRRLLVVDDNEINLMVMREMLESTGFQVALAVGGEDALEKVHAGSIDLVLLDLLMPGMNGYAVLEALRQNPRLLGLPVVAVSAAVTTDEREKVKGASFDGFIGKPVDIEKLCAVVGNLLGLKWLPEEEKSPPLPPIDEPLESPPVAALAELDELLALGKLPRAVYWAERLKERFPEYAPFAKRVEVLARELDEDGLRVLIAAGYSSHSQSKEQ